MGAVGLGDQYPALLAPQCVDEAERRLSCGNHVHRTTGESAEHVGRVHPDRCEANGRIGAGAAEAARGVLRRDDDPVERRQSFERTLQLPVVRRLDRDQRDVDDIGAGGRQAGVEPPATITGRDHTSPGEWTECHLIDR